MGSVDAFHRSNETDSFNCPDVAVRYGSAKHFSAVGAEWFAIRSA